TRRTAMLKDEIERQGEWLFRRRGYMPLVFALFVLISLHNYHWPFENYLHYARWAHICFGLSFVGLAIRCMTVGYAPAGTSGRNTDAQFALQLNTTGMYSLVRHPLYVGNFVIGLGVALAPFVWWLPLSYCLLFCAYYERIMFAEEAYLLRRFGNDFEN